MNPDHAVNHTAAERTLLLTGILYVSEMPLQIFLAVLPLECISSRPNFHFFVSDF